MPWWVIPAIASAVKGYSGYKAGSAKIKEAKGMFGLNQKRINRTFDIGMKNLDTGLSSVLSNIDVAGASQGRRGSGGSQLAISQDEIFKNILERERTIQQKEESLTQATLEKKRSVAAGKASQLAAIANVAGDMYKIGTAQPSSYTGSTGAPSTVHYPNESPSVPHSAPSPMSPRYY